MTTHWMPLVGMAKQEGEELVFPGLALPILGTPDAPFSVLRSNIRFEQGTVSFEVLLSQSNGTCTLGIPTAEGHIHFGFNLLNAPFGAGELRHIGGWLGMGGSGHDATLETDQWYSLDVSVNGSIITLNVQGVEVLRVNKITVAGALEMYFQSQLPIRVRNIRSNTIKPKCFVVMQFSPEYNDLYTHVIKPACEKFDYEVIRADEFWNSELIISDIIKSIHESSLIIADITPDNSNVFYELGYAHGIGKTTILMSNRTRTILPFDVRGNRTLFYDNSIAGKTHVTQTLEKHLEQIKQSTGDRGNYISQPSTR